MAQIIGCSTTTVSKLVRDGLLDQRRAGAHTGNARVYVYGGKPFERVGKYRKAQTKAKRSNRGLWGAC